MAGFTFHSEFQASGQNGLCDRSGFTCKMFSRFYEYG